MTSRLNGTVALVTGASSGIGEATAAALAAEGATVAIVARRKDRLESLAQQISAAGGSALVIEADITEQQAAADAVARTVSELGRLDILINNAGVMLLGTAVDAPLEEWERMVEINVKGLLYVTHAALPHLLASASTGPREVADLVNISSIAGRFPRAGSAVYNLTKHGVTGLSEALRQELAERHVRVSTVEPGAVLTELSSHIRPEAIQASKSRLANVERLESEDLADLIAYIVTRPRRMALNEVVVRPTNQV